MKRLIPKFTRQQLDAIATIQVEHNPLLPDNFLCKAMQCEGMLHEWVWWNRSTDEVCVLHSTDIGNWKIVPELGYTTAPGQRSLILSLDDDELEAWNDMADWLTNSDMFGHYYIGSWACGIQYQEGLGWLVHEEEMPNHEDVAIAAWLAGNPLPEGYYRLNRDAAERAIEYGVLHHGIGWIDGDADAPMIDKALQIAILGEDRYA